MPIVVVDGDEVIFDECDRQIVESRKWYIDRAHLPLRYVITTNLPHLKLHRLITSCPVGMVVDHINGNALDNRRDNLRVCSQQDNLRNRLLRRDSKTGFKGVGVQSRGGGFLARIGGGTNKRHLGTFKTAYEAAIAYDKAAIARYGDFACLNFPHMYPGRTYRSALQKILPAPACEK